MNNLPKAEQPKQATNFAWLFGFLWLPLAFVPSFVGLCFELNRWEFIALNAACSLVAAFGFWWGLIKKRTVRGALGIATGFGFFFLNLSIVALISVVFIGFNVLVSLRGCYTDPMK
jgi:hypothetical protein